MFRAGGSATVLILGLTLLVLSAGVILTTAWGTAGATDTGSFEPPSAAARAATRAVEDAARTDCFTRSQLTDLLRTRLSDAGVDGSYSVRSDGPVAVPIDEADAVLAHIRAGCYVYSGVGGDGNGNRIYFIAGPESVVDATPHP